MQPRLNSDSGFSSDSSVDQQFYPDSKKIKKLQRQISDLTAVKEAFLRKLININEVIDNMTQDLSACVQISQQNLKRHLEEIGNAKMSEWNRQMKICEIAERKIRSADESCINALSNYFTRKIGFIDDGEIHFVMRDFLFQKKIENFGKLTWKNEVRSEKLTPKFKIGGHTKEFKRPWGVCSDATGRILVTDRGNNKVQVFNEYGKFLFSFGKSGSGFGEFNSPSGITVDKKCRIIVSDRNNHRVQIFTFTGKFLISFGQKGTRPGEFQHPWDVAVNENCEIAVSDNENQRIQLFNTHGVYVTQFCFCQDALDIKQKVWPRGVAFKPDGSLLVTDVSNRCVFLIDKLFTTAVIHNFRFFKPQTVTCNRSGFFAVSDNESRKIQVFDEYGTLYKSFCVREFGCLLGICLLLDGGIAAADFGRNKVLIF